jgi:hypothetical protein
MTITVEFGECCQSSEEENTGTVFLASGHIERQQCEAESWKLLAVWQLRLSWWAW